MLLVVNGRGKTVHFFLVCKTVHIPVHIYVYYILIHSKLCRRFSASQASGRRRLVRRSICIFSILCIFICICRLLGLSICSLTPQTPLLPPFLQAYWILLYRGRGVAMKTGDKLDSMVGKRRFQHENALLSIWSNTTFNSIKKSSKKCLHLCL